MTVKDSAGLKSSEEKSTSSILKSIDASAGEGLKDFCKVSKASAGAVLAVKIIRDRERPADDGSWSTKNGRTDIELATTREQ